MRIKVTEIEATPEDLRQSKTLGDAFANALRNAFIGINGEEDEEDDDEE